MSGDMVPVPRDLLARLRDHAYASSRHIFAGGSDAAFEDATAAELCMVTAAVRATEDGGTGHATVPEILERLAQFVESSRPSTKHVYADEWLCYCDPAHLRALAAALAAPAPPETKAGRQWRHEKSGNTYHEVCRAHLCVSDAPPKEGDEVVIYRSAEGVLYAHEDEDFHRRFSVALPH